MSCIRTRLRGRETHLTRRRWSGCVSISKGAPGVGGVHALTIIRTRQPPTRCEKASSAHTSNSLFFLPLFFLRPFLPPDPPPGLPRPRGNGKPTWESLCMGNWSRLHTHLTLEYQVGISLALSLSFPSSIQTPKRTYTHMHGDAFPRCQHLSLPLKTKGTERVSLGPFSA
jgi:hypothetical protein